MTSAGGVTYSYDANGNNISSTDGRTITYTVFDQAMRIQKGSAYTEFSYGIGNQRIRRVDNNNIDSLRTTRYFGSVERIEQARGGNTCFRRYVGGVTTAVGQPDCQTECDQFSDFKMNQKGTLPMKSINSLLVLIVLFGLSGCSSMQVAELNPDTKRFPTTMQATVVKSVRTDLDSMKSLLLLPDNDFFKGQVANINYFDETMTVDDLETQIIRNELTEEVPSVRDKIGINKAYKAYKPFLWLRFDSRTEGGKTYGQIILTDPNTLEDYFVVEKWFDHVWAGVTDHNTWYPMFNAFVDYIDENSSTW